VVKVITYGTFDLLHYGHIRLLERAKALGDYLIVGVTADDFDKKRGKVNVQQSLMERMQAIKATGIADEIVVEEYQGQKIDDIRRLQVDVFAIGSDWKGYFDYLNEYCKVVYLDRTNGVSSSEIRSEKREIKFGLVGESNVLNKFANECKYINGVQIASVYSKNDTELDASLKIIEKNSYEELLDSCDAVYLISRPEYHYEQIKNTIAAGKHILCESPMAENAQYVHELFELARQKDVVLVDGIKTAYATAFHRAILMLKGGAIGNIVSVDATCTSIRPVSDENIDLMWTSINKWGPTALLPVFDLLGTNYDYRHIVSHYIDAEKTFDNFTKIDFVYPEAVASIKVANGVKSEGELIISGTKGYLYIPAPWWKTDYFEIRFENPANNKRYFYQLDGEGLRYEVISFMKNIESGTKFSYINEKISEAIVRVIESYNKKEGLTEISFNGSNENNRDITA